MIDKENKIITDPLEAAHEIQRVCSTLTYFIKAMDVLGMKGAEELACIKDDIYDLSKICADGICKEANERFKDSQQASANILNTVLSVCNR